MYVNWSIFLKAQQDCTKMINNNFKLKVDCFCLLYVVSGKLQVAVSSETRRYSVSLVISGVVVEKIAYIKQAVCHLSVHLANAKYLQTANLCFASQQLLELFLFPTV